ncbi:MAG: hypothetical protein ONB45_23885 [candidate division KSB1 bacterium]|nr:hypothetical protein [candidate division KSB1 bacterium]
MTALAAKVMMAQEQLAFVANELMALITTSVGCALGMIFANSGGHGRPESFVVTIKLWQF